VLVFLFILQGEIYNDILYYLLLTMVVLSSIVWEGIYINFIIFLRDFQRLYYIIDL